MKNGVNCPQGLVQLNQQQCNRLCNWRHMCAYKKGSSSAGAVVEQMWKGQCNDNY